MDSSVFFFLRSIQRSQIYHIEKQIREEKEKPKEEENNDDVTELDTKKFIE